MYKFYPSSALFSLGNENPAEWASQCHRAILLQGHGIRDRAGIAPEKAEMGADFEDRIQRVLGESFTQEGQIDKEVPLRIDLAPNAFLSGRVDYIVRTEDGPLVVECKSTQSRSTIKSLKDGKFSDAYVAQMAIYMGKVGARHGLLYVAVYDKKRNAAGKLILLYHRKFDVELDHATGEIKVGGRLYRYTYHDAVRCFKRVLENIETQTLPDRPTDHNSPWKSPCLRCPFAEACNSYEFDHGDFGLYLQECTAAVTK